MYSWGWGAVLCHVWYLGAQRVWQCCRVCTGGLGLSLAIDATIRDLQRQHFVAANYTFGATNTDSRSQNVGAAGPKLWRRSPMIGVWDPGHVWHLGALFVGQCPGMCLLGRSLVLAYIWHLRALSAGHRCRMGLGDNSPVPHGHSILP